ncbi:MAG: class I SAM-dependent methyltransferase [Rhodocyclaceae bacterium]|nr:class I SAM-dependent methyltransferase [Rhodocyclaceae bacterium]
MSMSALREWLETPLGSYAMQWEQARYDQAVVDIFGFNAVQIGLPEFDLLRANRMPLRVRSAGVPADVQLRLDETQLPFAAQSVDLMVLPHVLEFSRDPHQVLREVERVLVPEGNIVLSGFNPYSLWGLRRLWRRQGASYPWNGVYLSVPRLKDWLKLLGFETHAGWFGCYVPPVRTEKWLLRCAFMDAAGDRWWPIAGGAYVLQAVKRAPGMRVITPRWKDRLAAAKALAAPVEPRANKH